MNIQQLEYIVALDKYKHFSNAAEHCGISQPTLSMMIQKLEAELDISIFDRTKQPVEATKIGKTIIEQAKRTIYEMKKINELVKSDIDKLTGSLHIGVIPTLAPYLVPELIKNFKQNYPDINLTISEMTTDELIRTLRKSDIDMFIAATPLKQSDFYEIPLYYEKFLAYFSENNPYIDLPLSASNMPKDNLWILEEGHCFRDQVFNFCTETMSYNQMFEAGSIDTLVRIVDANGGYSVIPELHLSYLSEQQRKNVREIDNPPAIREISIVIKQDFIRESMVNAVADAIKTIIPDQMIDERLKKFSIRLF